jgi:hypothetical protein
LAYALAQVNSCLASVLLLKPFIFKYTHDYHVDVSPFQKMMVSKAPFLDETCFLIAVDSARIGPMNV